MFEDRADHRPVFLDFLDQPFLGVGRRNGAQQSRQVQFLQLQLELFASGDLSFAAQTADRILVMEDGAVVEDIAPESLDADIIRRYFKTEVLVSRNIYNGRPEVHFFPGT